MPKTTRGRIEFAAAALKLRDEQLKAQVVYVDPDLETNAELDAITAQVVAELKRMQSEQLMPSPKLDAQQVEIELIKNLRELLEKMLSARRERFLALKVQNIQRRITGLFFSSEVLAATNDESGVRSVYSHADDAVLHALRRHEKAILDDIEKMQFVDPKVKADAIERLKFFQKQLMGQVLSRSRPELERLLKVFAEVLVTFLMKDFPAAVGEFAWEVIRESRVALSADLTYKIREKSFSAFRHAFERRFLERLLASVQQPLAQRLESGDDDGGFRPETIRFAGEPRIYAEICDVTCNSVYDYLHGEGFLDLPVKWQEHLAKTQ
ncbi:MAG: hypothetical protein H5U40_18710 [Polyangiaceae bacterium]|nr:hypothetical protein [Polyangiaceae bacterium]